MPGEKQGGVGAKIGGQGVAIGGLDVASVSGLVHFSNSKFVLRHTKKLAPYLVDVG